MKLILITALSALLFFTVLSAAETGISLNGARHDTSQDLQITADQLRIEQETNSAVFKGNAKVAQGDIRFSADKISIFYAQNSKSISNIKAIGHVVFTNSTETAEANSATYNVKENTIILRGNVLLLQGRHAISGDTIHLNLKTGKARVSGNVKTIIAPN